MSRPCSLPQLPIGQIGLSPELLAECDLRPEASAARRQGLTVDARAFKWLGIGLDNAHILTSREQWSKQDGGPNQRSKR